MNMHALSSSIRRCAIDASELTMADRFAIAREIGGRRAQDLVVMFGITRTEAKRLLKLREQLGRAYSPCVFGASAAVH